MARVSPSGRKYGWRGPSRPDPRDHIYSAGLVHATNLPVSVDLRSKMPPIYDQGDLGSCSANSIGAAIEYERRKQGLAPDIMPSRLFIYYNERMLEGSVDSDSGADLRDGIKSVNKWGVCPESEWPYDIHKFTAKPSPKCYTDALKEQVIQYASVPQTLTNMKSVLAAGCPIVYGFTVFESFESDNVAKTGIVPLPQHSEQNLGGHAVLCVGYDDAKQTIIVRNSWGNLWGDKGYFYMPYSYALNSQLAADFWVIKMVKG